MSTSEEKVKYTQQQNSWRSFVNSQLKGTIVQYKVDVNGKETDSSFQKKSLVTKRTENPKSLVSTLFGAFITDGSELVLLNGLASKISKKLFKGKDDFKYLYYDMMVKNIVMVILLTERELMASSSQGYVFQDFLSLYSKTDIAPVIHAETKVMSDKFTQFVHEICPYVENTLAAVIRSSDAYNRYDLGIIRNYYNNDMTNVQHQQFKLVIENFMYSAVSGISGQLFQVLNKYLPIGTISLEQWLAMEDKGVSTSGSSEINAYEIPLYGYNLGYLSESIANISNKAGSKTLIDSGRKSDLARYDEEEKRIVNVNGVNKEVTIRKYHYGGEFSALEGKKQHAWKLSCVFGLINHVSKDENEGKEIEVLVKGVKSSSQLYTALLKRIEGYLVHDLEYAGNSYALSDCKLLKLINGLSCLKVNQAKVKSQSDYTEGAEFSGITVADVTKNVVNFTFFDIQKKSTLNQGVLYVIESVKNKCLASCGEIYQKYSYQFTQPGTDFRQINNKIMEEFKVAAAKHAKEGADMFTPQQISDMIVSFIGLSIPKNQTELAQVQAKALEYKAYVEKLAAEEIARRQRNQTVGVTSGGQHYAPSVFHAPPVEHVLQSSHGTVTL